MVELHRMGEGYNTSQYIYNDIAREVERVFRPQWNGPYFYHGEREKMIKKLEVRWLPRRGPDLEGYPCTLAIDENNACAVLKMILQRLGTDIIEVTMGANWK